MENVKEHAWHWANELCVCGAPMLKSNRPLSVKSAVPTR